LKETNFFISSGQDRGRALIGVLATFIGELATYQRLFYFKIFCEKYIFSSPKIVSIRLAKPDVFSQFNTSSLAPNVHAAYNLVGSKSMYRQKAKHGILRKYGWDIL
jgi:hypothetical protein